jgi:hypothetical protein
LQVELLLGLWQADQALDVLLKSSLRLNYFVANPP